MSNIDWSKAPSDATHYHPAVNGYVDHWWKDGWFCVLGFENDGWRYDSRSELSECMIARPVVRETWQAAFPSPGVVLNPGGHNPQQQGAYEGMSLRDYFAAKAMQGLCAYPHNGGDEIEDVVAEAFLIADAMLAEREK